MKDRNLEHSNDWATPKSFYDTLHAEFDYYFLETLCDIYHKECAFYQRRF